MDVSIGDSSLDGNNFNRLASPLLVCLKRISFEEMQVDITVAEIAAQVPFSIKRVYWLRSGETSVVRGNHAHLNASQFIVALQGEAVLSITNSKNETKDFLLNNDQIGVVVPSKHWLKIEMSKHSVLLCLSSQLYGEQITEYCFKKFLQIV